MVDEHSRQVESLVQAGLGVTGIPILGFLGPLVAPVLAEQERRVSVALRAAEGLSGMKREELEDLLKSDPAAVSFVTRLLFAAGKNGHDDILKMMGRSLFQSIEARKALDEERLLEEEMILVSLEDITPSHIRLMIELKSHAPRRVGRNELARLSGVSPRSCNYLLDTLESRSLIYSPTSTFASAEDSEFYEVSELGELVLTAAAEVAARL